MADTADLKSAGGNPVRVRIPPSAPQLVGLYYTCFCIKQVAHILTSPPTVLGYRANKVRAFANY